MTNSVALSNGARYSYQLPWDGRLRLKGTVQEPLAFDTETELIDRSLAYHVPRLALATASSPQGQVILRPEQLASFLLLHAGEHLVCHNATFDFWVVNDYLLSLEDASMLARRARESWWTLCGEGRLHDTMVLDQLVRLAVDGPARLERRNLGELASTYLALKVDKQDVFRTRYGELIGADWSQADNGFWEYAVKDAIVTRLLYPRLRKRAEDLLAAARRLNPKLVRQGCEREYGPLTETLQVKGAVALFDAGRRGIRVDIPAAIKFCQGLRNELELDVARIQAWDSTILLYRDELSPSGAVSKKKLQTPIFPGFEREVALTAKGKAPRLRKDRLATNLKLAAEEAKLPLPKSEGKTGGMSLAAKHWKNLGRQHTGIAAWLGLSKRTKILGYSEPLTKVAEVHPYYNPLMVTGRASARNPNLMQSARDDRFREIFKPRAGNLLLIVDFAAVELRTLASVCELRYGKSAMADVIRSGKDLHTHTASLVSGVLYTLLDSWLSAGEDDPRRKQPEYKLYKRYRQSAKALSFGVPGGLGPKKLASYAQDSYGVTMSVDEAAALRKKLVREVYPELNLYLSDNLLTDLAWNLGLTREQVASRLGARNIRRAMRELSDLTRGEAVQGDTAALWRQLQNLAAPSQRLPAWVKKQLVKREASEQLWRRLFGGLAASPCGRLASGRSYTQKSNYSFQALASDGAKLALWSLLSKGHKVVGFVHDEILVECPAEKAQEHLKEVSRLMNEAMESVLRTVPSAVSAVAADRWLK